MTQNAAGAQVSETVDNTDGSHTMLGSAPNLILEAIGNDTITGGGAGETFDFANVFGHDTLTDFYKYASGSMHDTIALSTADLTGHSGSQLTLQGLDKTALAGLAADFKFHA